MLTHTSIDSTTQVVSAAGGHATTNQESDDRPMHLLDATNHRMHGSGSG